MPVVVGVGNRRDPGARVARSFFLRARSFSSRRECSGNPPLADPRGGNPCSRGPAPFLLPRMRPFCAVSCAGPLFAPARQPSHPPRPGHLTRTAWNHHGFPEQILVYPATDDEEADGEPQVKAAGELWPSPRAREGAANGHTQIRSAAGEPHGEGAAELWPSPRPCAGASHGQRRRMTAPRSHVLAAAGRVTTFAVRNLRAKATARDVLQELHSDGLRAHCDWIYVPRDLATSAGVGVAFVNFNDTHAARAFFFAWHATRRPRLQGRLREEDEGVPAPLLDVAPARIQGKAANARSWTSARRARLKDVAFHPLDL